MKVLLVSSYAGLSGASHSLVGMANEFKTIGVTPIVLLPTEGPLEDILLENDIKYFKKKLYNWITPIQDKGNPIKILKWYIKNMVNCAREQEIYKIMKEEQIEILHINASTASWGVRAAKRLDIPIIWHIREFLEEDLNKTFWNKKKALKKIGESQKIIAISDSVKRKYEEILPSSKLIRIYNGINTSPYKKITNELYSKRVIHITLAGRISENKGHEEVIMASKELLDKKLPKLQVNFVGSEEDTEYVAYLKKMISDLNLDETIKFIGYRGDMESVWAETDIALVTSKAEAFGRVTIEAMMAGALVVGANTAGTKELLADNRGILYEQGNYKSLANKLAYAIHNKEEMRNKAEESRVYAMNNFTSEQNANLIYGVYKKLLNDYKNDLN